MKTKTFAISSIFIIAFILLAVYFFFFNKPIKVAEIDVLPYEKQIEHNTYDLIVIGGEPEGVSAAVSAARNGANVLLLEHRDGLGGLYTYGMLNYLDLPYNNHNSSSSPAFLNRLLSYLPFSNHKEIVSHGIFKEWHEWIGGEHIITVDLDVAENAFFKLIQSEENITLSLTSTVTDVIIENNKLRGLVVEDEKGTHTYYAETFIDSTADGDIAAMAGAPYFVGQADIGKEDKMAVTLMIYLDNVDWKEVEKAANDGVLGGAGINETSAWGFPDVLREYEPIAENDLTQVRGLNIGRTPRGEVFINALQIFGVDGLDEEEKQRAIELGIRETDNFIPWLQENLPGFEEATIVRYPDELYIRETRHIESEYMLPVSALWENEHHWDDIAIGGYPADIQATAKSNTGTITVNPNQYGIPYRSLVPLEIDGLLVASKASGYSSLAAGSTRVVPTGMATAQAAGLASTIVKRENIEFRDLIDRPDLIEELQECLKDQGAYLVQLDDPDYPYKGEPYYPAIQLLYSYDLISGGYENDFFVEEDMNALSFMQILRAGIARIHPDTYATLLPNIEKLMIETPSAPMTQDHLEHIVDVLGLPVEVEENKETYKRYEAFMILANLLENEIK